MINYSEKKTIAIMQPTYLPWLGYFGLMKCVDHFVFLDSVQFARRSWQQRNQIKTSTGPQWLTVPVISKNKRDQAILDVEIDYTQNFPRSHLRAIELNYKKTPYYDRYMPKLTEILLEQKNNLSDLTITIINWIKHELEINTKIYKSSDFNVSGSKDILLFKLCKELGATHYISVPGSSNYLENSNIFSNSNIIVKYFNFSHPNYKQPLGEFIPYMSVIDILFNIGPESVGILESTSGKISW